MMLAAGLVASIVAAATTPTVAAAEATISARKVPVSASVTSSSTTVASSLSQQQQQQHQQQKMTSSVVIPPPAAAAADGADRATENRHQRSELPFENMKESRRDDGTQSQTTTRNKNKNNMLRMPYIRQDELPIDNVRQKWQSLSEDVEFVPSDQIDRKFVGRFLEQQQQRDKRTTVTKTVLQQQIPNLLPLLRLRLRPNQRVL